MSTNPGLSWTFQDSWSLCDSLTADAKKRYVEKISLIDGLDPFSGSLGACTDAVPPVDASDLVQSSRLYGFIRNLY